MNANPIGSNLFERMALGSNAIAEMTFDIEAARFGKAARALPCEAPVFVTGLARAGTTALLRALFAQRCFATLTFRDLPFPLAPNSWSRLGKMRHAISVERGQEDGIFQDLDSPEALEEIFWRVFDHRRYIASDRLNHYTVPEDTLNAYGLYVRLILLRHDGSRYLAKNNNNILRLDSLNRLWPDALFMHPFRDPLQHSASLYHHHLKATEQQRDKPARLHYMNHLVHHEFGLGHRPFAFTTDVDTDIGPSDGLDHWLRQWIAAYQFLLEHNQSLGDRQCFVDIDHIVAESAAADHLIRAVTGAAPLPYPPFRAAKPHNIPAVDPILLQQAKEVHQRLVVRAKAPQSARSTL